MVPCAPHRVTIGTGERRIKPTVVLIGVGQPPIGPSGVFDQSNAAMISESLPPPARNAWSDALPEGLLGILRVVMLNDGGMCRHNVAGTRGFRRQASSGECGGQEAGQNAADQEIFHRVIDALVPGL